IPGVGNGAKEIKRPIVPSTKKPLCSLSCWPGDGWFKERPASVRLLFKNRPDELQIVMKDSGSWVKPVARPEWADFQPWTYDDIPVMWNGWERKLIPFEVTKQNNVEMKINNANGFRKFAVGFQKDGKKLLQRYHGKYMSINSPLPRLDEVKDMTLEWKDKRKHPYLFLNKNAFVKAAQYDQAAYKSATNVTYLLKALDSLGHFDLMREPKHIVFLYDMNIDSPRLTKEQRAIAKAQMAYLGYLLENPMHWSFERGMNSGNPNMVVSRILSLSMIGCNMPGSIQGQKWIEYGRSWMQYWLDNVVDDQGYWLESSHYARVTWSYFILYSIMSRNSGNHDFFKNKRFRAMCDFYTKTNSPPDPLRRTQSPLLSKGQSSAARVDVPYGRGVRGDAYDYAGLLAKATAKSDPEFSARMQWCWKESGYAEFFRKKSAGVSSLYLDHHLPMNTPDWKSEKLNKLGYLLRSNVGQKDENFLMLVSKYYRNADGEFWPSNTGGIMKWYAGGVPMGTAFTRLYGHSHVLLENRVMLACNWDPKSMKPYSSGYVSESKHNGFSTLDQQDFVDVDILVPEIKEHPIRIDPKAPAFPKRKTVNKVPLNWKRQILLVKGDQNYMVMRDTVRSKSPTQWHFWSLSEQIAPHGDVQNRKAFMKTIPGRKNVDAYEIKGDRFTAVGQFGVDLEYYVASPSNTPRYTLRYGRRESAYGIHAYHEYQDLMHLQLDGDGVYFVCMFPNKAGQKAPTFTTHGKGNIIRIKGEFGTDYCFIAEKSTRAKADDAAFSGICGSVQDRHNSLTLNLSSPGSVSYKGYHIEAPFAVTMIITPTHILLKTSTDDSDGEIKVSAAATASLAYKNGKKVIMTKKLLGSKIFTISKKAGYREIRLERNN
ncbi:MAG: hypothetical protein HRT89_07930, partial [Lentisphaeria bacterium]|nr:hypothetical protein [Lentisphaeria bacterium]NQZ67983.1 hypothetical protein [Lentisphaeria bacterium]